MIVLRHTPLSGHLPCLPGSVTSQASLLLSASPPVSPTHRSLYPVSPAHQVPKLNRPTKSSPASCHLAQRTQLCYSQTDRLSHQLLQLTQVCTRHLYTQVTQILLSPVLPAWPVTDSHCCPVSHLGLLSTNPTIHPSLWLHGSQPALLSCIPKST